MTYETHAGRAVDGCCARFVKEAEAEGKGNGNGNEGEKEDE